MRKSLDSGKPTVVPGFDPDSWWPSISPDGTQVLVFQPKPGSPFQWASVFPVSGGNATTLTIPVPASEISFPGIGTHEKRLKWAADGKSLLFVRRDANGVDNVWSASSAGGPAKPLTSFVDPLRIFAFDMGPDNQLAVSRGKYISDVVLIKNVR
jgi:hypothetical protein